MSRSGRCWGVAGAALGLAAARRELSWRRWGLAGAALEVPGSVQGRSGRRWGVAGNVLGVAGASQKLLWASLGHRRTLWASLGPRRGCSGRCWSLPGDALGVAGASGMFDFNSVLYPTSMLALGFNAFLHFNVPSWSQCFASFQEFFGWASDLAFGTDARGRDLSVSTWTGSFRWCPMEECPTSTAFQDVVSSRHRAGWLGMG